MDSDSDDWDPSQELRKLGSKQGRSKEFVSPSQTSSRLRLSLSSRRNNGASRANISTMNATVESNGLSLLSTTVTQEALFDSSSSEASSPKRPKFITETAGALTVKRKSDLGFRRPETSEPGEQKPGSEPESDYTFTFETQELRTETPSQTSTIPQCAVPLLVTRKSGHKHQPNDTQKDQKSQSAQESDFTFTFETQGTQHLETAATPSETTTEPKPAGKPAGNIEASRTDALVNEEDDMLLESLLDPDKRNTIQDWINNVETASSVSAPSVASNCSHSTVEPPRQQSTALLNESTRSGETTQPLVLEGMKTPSKLPVGASNKSPASKQTTITAFYSARGTPEPETVIPEENSLTEDNQGPLTVIREHAKSAWSSLMSRMRGTAATVREALQAAESTVETATVPAGRTCPFYKRIPNTSFVVDAFSYGKIPGVTGYFLTHFHYDHYGGLGNWLDKPLYCSQITANLVKLKLKLNYNLIKPLPLNESRIIENVEVIALDANHCPGAVMFLFRPLSGKTYLHVGDFRAHPDMEKCRHLKFSPIDQLFLDTTYCSEEWSFPPQEDVVDYIKGLVRENYERLGRKLLVVCGSYTIGKEKVFRAAAEEIRSKIWAPPQKRRVLDCLDDPELSRSIVADPRSAQVHVVNMGDLSVSNLQKYLAELEPDYTHILALKPTGWEYDQSVSRKGLQGIPIQSYGRIQVCGVPYSEHSSYEELRRFVKFFRPKEITPTVNVGSQKARQQMKAIFERWMEEPLNSYSDQKRLHRSDEQEFIQSMKNPSSRRGRGGRRPQRKMQFAK